MRQLFISYARENKPDVEALVRDLHALGCQTWLDTSLRGGQSWWQEILGRIADSDVFVAIVSDHTLRSVACKRELEWALALNKPVLPIAVQRLPDALPRTLSMRQIVDYSQSGREAAFALAGALGTLPPAPPIPTELPEPPGAPLSYLSDLVEQAGQSEPLTQQQQHQILIQLEPALRSSDTEERRGGRFVLEMFSRRGDLYADVDRTLAQMVLTSRETKPDRAHGPTPDARVQPAPETSAVERGNLLADPQWADALSAFFAKRWTEAAQRFEALLASYPAEGRVESRLAEARRQRDIDMWSSTAEVSTANGDWDTVVTALQNLTTLDPNRPDTGPRLEQALLAQRRKTLLDEISALHQAGEWSAVVAAAAELARSDPDSADPNGIVSDAQAKIRESERAERYTQALNHLDQERWQQAGELLTAIEHEQPGYRDAAALLRTVQLKTAAPVDVSPAAETPPPPDPVVDRGGRKPHRWLIAAIPVAVVVVVAAFVAIGRGSAPSDTAATTSIPPPPAATTTPAPPTAPPHAHQTLSDYATAGTIAPRTPGAPTIDLPIPAGWAPIPDTAYFGIALKTPLDPTDPPKITANLLKLTGVVDINKVLATAPGEIENLAGFDREGSEDKVDALDGHPTVLISGTYLKNSGRRVIAQYSVVIQGKDAVYVLQITADGPPGDADTTALVSATGAIVAGTKIVL